MPDKRKRGGKAAPNPQAAIPSIGYAEESAGPQDLLMPSSTDGAPIFRVLTPELAALPLYDHAAMVNEIDALLTGPSQEPPPKIPAKLSKKYRDWLQVVNEKLDDTESLFPQAGDAQKVGGSACAQVMAKLYRSINTLLTPLGEFLRFTDVVATSQFGRALRSQVAATFRVVGMMLGKVRQGVLSESSLTELLAAVRLLRKGLRDVGELVGAKSAIMPLGNPQKPVVHGDAVPHETKVDHSDDQTAYQLATEFIIEEYPTIKAIHKALKKAPTIRTIRPKGKNGKPIPNRLKIHTGDWHVSIKQNRQTADALDQPATIVDKVMEAEKRKAQILEQKGRMGK